MLVICVIAFWLNSVLCVPEPEPIVEASAFKIRLTPLQGQDWACHAENLKEATTYLCDRNGKVICRAGWKEPEEADLRDPLNPCPLPVCDFQNSTCVHGECFRPNLCACEVGWEGTKCDRCVKLPGCVHGTCNDAFECNCQLDQNGRELWTGAYCDCPACSNCPEDKGRCLEPHVCTCFDGWTGESCETCLPLAGCMNGQCKDGKPHTCECHPGWEGPLCDRMLCREGCHEEHGFCHEVNTCVCRNGYQGFNCDQCIPYWRCPSGGSCSEPNQCVCDEDAESRDVYGVCNRVDINGPRMGERGECSNPCQKNDELLLNAPGERITKCNWDERTGGPCADFVEECYGDKAWILCDDCETDYLTCCQNKNDIAALVVVRNSLNNSLVEGCVLEWNYNVNLNGSSVSKRSAATDEFGKCTVAVALTSPIVSIEDTIEVEVTLTRDGYAPLTTVLSLTAPGQEFVITMDPTFTREQLAIGALDWEAPLTDLDLYSVEFDRQTRQEICQVGPNRKTCPHSTMGKDIIKGENGKPLDKETVIWYVYEGGVFLMYVLADGGSNLSRANATLDCIDKKNGNKALHFPENIQEDHTVWILGCLFGRSATFVKLSNMQTTTMEHWETIDKRDLVEQCLNPF